MNILEQEDLIKGAPDDLLLQEAQSPTGRVPQFLVVSEIQRRKSMRDRFSAQEQQPEQSVAEQIVAGATPQGIGALQPQMPSQAPSMPMQAPQMSPEMMAPQNAPMAPPPQMMAAGGGRMPYRRMAGGGIVPPNSLVEDASKFNPENLYDMDASQMAMASPTNMGIASVLPMAGGGIVRMAKGEQVVDNFVSMDNLPGNMTKEKWEGLSEEQKNTYANTLQGKKGIQTLMDFPKVALNANRIMGENILGNIGNYVDRITGFADPSKPYLHYESVFNKKPKIPTSISDIEKVLNINSPTTPLGYFNSIASPIDPNIIFGADILDSNLGNVINDLDTKPDSNGAESESNVIQKNKDRTPAPEVPVLETDYLGSTNISSLLNENQGTELKTARDLLRKQLDQEVNPYDPTELLLKSQERSDKRALNEALIAFGAGIARGDVASGLESAGKSVAGIKDKQEVLQQQLEVRRGEAQAQSQKDRINRDIQIAQADISAIESDEGRKDKLLGRKLQYEKLYMEAVASGNDISIKQFTAELAANKFLRSQFEFQQTLNANFSKQEQLNFRATLDFVEKTFKDTHDEIVKRGLYPEKGEKVKTSIEIQKELEVARKRLFNSLDSLKKKGKNYNPAEKPEPTEVEGLVKGEDGVYRSK